MAEMINKWDVVDKLIHLENEYNFHKWDAQTLYRKLCEVEVEIGKTSGVGWIPVTERLPEEGDDVLVFGYWHERYQPLKCHLSPHYKGCWFTSVAGQEVYAVTHWMPLPQPPKELGPAEGR